MNQNFGQVSALIVGIQNSLNWSINDILVSNSTISSTNKGGLICGVVLNNGSILQIQIIQSNISLNSMNQAVYCGGLLGWIKKNANTTIQNVKFIASNVSGISQQLDTHAGAIVGEQWNNASLTIMNTITNSIVVFVQSSQRVSFLGGIIGTSYFNSIFQSIQMLNSSICSFGNLNIFQGGVIAYQTSSSNVSIFDVQSNYSYISGSSNQSISSGGIVGYALQTNILISSVTINNFTILCIGQTINSKLITSFSASGPGTIKLVNSKSLGTNIINNDILNNCILTNITTINGC
ncbi:Hypothetical_protein [Hexamita inflata]|uniref:Hypothetical_protein n=1 Tax=Hexamita inflata TaxID=28002 RepID=A0AA86RTT9_9EUKA|nr:Hypothetical protein HINF_LOCUS22453 [Hexamita inflata]CAI9972410.1 Hypothetical protein HINF_LOCUS60055 [Hexamita inflata]